MLTSLLLLGFGMGLRHALEADHVATVASLATRSWRLRDLVAVAGAWGIGHAAVLVAAGLLVVLAGFQVPSGELLEALVGAVLVWLGIDVLRRSRRRRLHLHRHRHADGTEHLHVHAHEPDAAAPRSHADGHAHAHPPLWRALGIGALHGAAGSAALLLLFVPSLGTARALAYVAVYALGSLAGMLLLSVAVSLPLRLGAPRLARARRPLESSLGIASIALGVWIASRAGQAWMAS